MVDDSHSRMSIVSFNSLLPHSTVRTTCYHLMPRKGFRNSLILNRFNVSLLWYFSSFALTKNFRIDLVIGFTSRDKEIHIYTYATNGTGIHSLISRELQRTPLSIKIEYTCMSKPHSFVERYAFCVLSMPKGF